MISSAAVWKFSDTDWDVAAVSTIESRRRQGLSKQVISFVTDYILNSDRIAVSCTEDSNQAMWATAQSIGFKLVPFEKVWWRYPDLPDF